MAIRKNADGSVTVGIIRPAEEKTAPPAKEVSETKKKSGAKKK